jgi:hypothetical protein
MSTWWEQRNARVSQAARIVSTQAQCSRGQAIALLRKQAEQTGADLEDTALAVVARRISFTRINSASDV